MRGAVAFAAVLCAACPALAEPAGPDIHTEDVTLFYKIYDAAGGHPTADQLQHDYLDQGSQGLHTLAKLRNITGVRIEDELTNHPEVYTDARRCMAVLPQVRVRLTTALAKLVDRLPGAQFPPVTILVTRGKPVGVADASGVMIGLDALCSVTWMNPNVEDRFVHVVAHEYTHVQQALLAPTLYNNEHPTVLEASIVEGAAEFTAELISGEPGEISGSAFKTMTEGHETEIETAFVGDEDKTDLSKWLYNGSMTKPGDLGYWVGYRIVKSWYEHAPDKRGALREILSMTNAHAFLAKSGWSPGIKLE
jgi:uncharacterized protein YjaZ